MENIFFVLKVVVKEKAFLENVEKLEIKWAENISMKTSRDMRIFQVALMAIRRDELSVTGSTWKARELSKAFRIFDARVLFWSGNFFTWQRLEWDDEDSCFPSPDGTFIFGIHETIRRTIPSFSKLRKVSQWSDHSETIQRVNVRLDATLHLLGSLDAAESLREAQIEKFLAREILKADRFVFLRLWLLECVESQFDSPTVGDVFLLSQISVQVEFWNVEKLFNLWNSQTAVLVWEALHLVFVRLFGIFRPRFGGELKVVKGVSDFVPDDASDGAKVHRCWSISVKAWPLENRSGELCGFRADLEWQEKEIEKLTNAVVFGVVKRVHRRRFWAGMEQKVVLHELRMSIQ